MMKIDYGIVSQALLGKESECGDIGIVVEHDNQCFIALVDVLGHGAEARVVALKARAYLKQNCNYDLVDIMNGLHNHLKGTRGAVAALCRLDVATGELCYVGIGNISVRIFGFKSLRLVPRDGIIGYMMPKPQKQVLKLSREDILVLHSDGIKEHFEKFECAAFIGGTAESIAAGILKRFGIKKDDASCIVLKYLKNF